jgi:hypothetical protein
MKQMGNATCMVETNNAYKVLAGKCEVRRLFKRPGTDGIIFKWTVTLWYLASAIPSTQYNVWTAECQVQIMDT